MTEKVWLVTGAARGLVRAAARRGHRVAATEPEDVLGQLDQGSTR
ncbi:hypothetical protein [Nonomuraea endophytica]|uniref:NAD(P)-dependent dehydrogenase (Short-subunit alcohol dehydrogenase family) n=1 Tax=Nonomuraea endophytica TaxID=714136 RepID=A0A7W8A8U9_9ACTN|nr:hypothetical protein [Nonomuraea endophytica]MBB5081767.1 NAD(P)-dependent dehydrogenase (short-subunit alcohol dehydrogenase family) [Nonomuraea endophytica]